MLIFASMNTTALQQIPLFRSLDPTELQNLFAELNLNLTHFEKGEMLTMQDEPVNRLILLLTGSVSAQMTDQAGRIMKVEQIEAPNPLAILFLFGKQNRFPVQAIANEACTAIIIPKQAVLKMLCSNQTILLNYLDISADFATRLSQKLHFVSFRTIRQKVAVYLLEMSKQQKSETITLDRSKSALAEYFGVARPSLEREITHMKQQGVITADRRTITIKDREQLTQLINN